MDPYTTILIVMTCALVFVTIHAKLIGNEKRDVALLGAVAAAAGLGTAVVASA